jgi:hypothetical protein
MMMMTMTTMMMVDVLDKNKIDACKRSRCHNTTRATIRFFLLVSQEDGKVVAAKNSFTSVVRLSCTVKECSRSVYAVTVVVDEVPEQKQSIKASAVLHCCFLFCV